MTPEARELAEALLISTVPFPYKVQLIDSDEVEHIRDGSGFVSVERYGDHMRLLPGEIGVRMYTRYVIRG